ncbi:MAG: arsenate reductase ArsC [Bifidobacterium sp.]|jgi:arsenate reductase|nr:arsenate reductase ArsC [Bifidobacterium sp.]
MDTKTTYSVAFICTRNACRSQMAQAIAAVMYPDVMTAFSAGTEPGNAIDPVAVDMIRRRYGIDMTRSQRSKPLSELPVVDVVVTMGCGVACPALEAGYREDWGLDDPMGGPRQGYAACIDAIEDRMVRLAAALRSARSSAARRND